jgi:hypothetical protein
LDLVTLSANFIDAEYIGREVVNIVECEHLAFRGGDTDGQNSVDGVI